MQLVRRGWLNTCPCRTALKNPACVRYRGPTQHVSGSTAQPSTCPVPRPNPACVRYHGPVQHVFDTTVNVHTIPRTKRMHKRWFYHFFTILKPYFHHKNASIYSRSLLSDRYLCLWSFVQSSQKWIRFLILFQLKNSRFSHGFKWLLLAATPVEI